MTTIAHQTNHLGADTFRAIITLSAWGFALAVTSLLFLWLGYILDGWFGTAPKFMLTLVFLSVVGCFIEIYQEAVSIVNKKT
jgi:F0F1-type ATP synthase assembly protein I